MEKPTTTSPGAGAVLRIDFDALVANYRTLTQAAMPARVAAVVKADGYGVGAKAVVELLAGEGCRQFFVAMLGEARAICPVLPADAEVFVLNGLQPGAEEAFLASGAIPVLNSLDQIERWSILATSLGRKLRAALQVDSGMSRMGLSSEETAILTRNPGMLEAIDPCLLMTHLACADEPGHPENARQYARFLEATAPWPGIPRALDNSGGIFLPREHFDVVRAGIALYGGAPHSGPNPMAPVISLEARIAQVRTVPPGTGVGYGMSFLTQRETRIATIPVGYADGLPRSLGNRGSAYVAGNRVPMVGRVSMDSITLDVTGVAEQHCMPGSPVELIGPHQSLDELARDAGTISYEILTQLGHRYEREFLPLERGRASCGIVDWRSAAE